MVFGVWCLLCIVYVYKINGPDDNLKVIAFSFFNQKKTTFKFFT